MAPFTAPPVPPFGMPTSEGPYFSPPGNGRSSHHPFTTRDVFPVERQTTTTYKISTADGRRFEKTQTVSERMQPLAPMSGFGQWHNGPAHFQSQANYGYSFPSSHRDYPQATTQGPGAFDQLMKPALQPLPSDVPLLQPFTPGESAPAQHVPQQHQASSTASSSWPSQSAAPNPSGSTGFEIPSNQPTWASSASLEKDIASEDFFDCNGMQGMASIQEQNGYTFAPAPYVEPVEFQSQSPWAPSEQTFTLSASSSHAMLEPQNHSEMEASSQAHFAQATGSSESTFSTPAVQPTFAFENAEQRYSHMLSELSPSSSMSGDADIDVDYDDEDEDADGEDDAEDDEDMEQVYPNNSNLYNGCVSPYEGHTPGPYYYYAEAGAQTTYTMAGDQHYGTCNAPTPGSSSTSGESMYDALAPIPGYNGAQNLPFTQQHDRDFELFGYSPAPTPSS